MRLQNCSVVCIVEQRSKERVFNLCLRSSVKFYDFQHKTAFLECGPQIASGVYKWKWLLCEPQSGSADRRIGQLPSDAHFAFLGLLCKYLLIHLFLFLLIKRLAYRRSAREGAIGAKVYAGGSFINGSIYKSMKGPDPYCGLADGTWSAGISDSQLTTIKCTFSSMIGEVAAGQMYYPMGSLIDFWSPIYG
ncbi:hypothetical protein HAX54_046298 [Datura stramonium]|uniref:Uncharacterized protein n=1 Tax=Datura stramonium TaxID=4076 RepID=A0ABS8SRQ1_DATST|nr:hypothetical protein [Datura stramonium]